MKSKKIRSLFLNFFQQKNHKIVESSKIVVKDDPTLMFTNAGMNQFKDLFLGNSSVSFSRAANSQKCLRVAGKHNDLEEVGHDTYHHTMFEMLGNWSFGDYFKKEAISWAWEFLIEKCKLDKDRIYVTIFEGSDDDNLEKDTESYSIWKNFMSEDRIIDGSKKDNFWEMGSIGPCGPCSEIHYDNRDHNERIKVNGRDLVNRDHPDVIEIWNLVFMQFNRKSDSSLEDLPQLHVDTGMGFERLCMIMQNVKSNYETDIFSSIIMQIEKGSGFLYGKKEERDIAMRVIADHIRSISFCIADGQLPSNVGAGYVVRRILRRSVRYAHTFLGVKDPFIFNLVDGLIDSMGDHYPELVSQKKLVKEIIYQEEISFLRTLEKGLNRLNLILKTSKKIVSGKVAFELYDTYGFPLDLTQLIVSEHNFELEISSFYEEMQKQKDRSRLSASSEMEDWKVLLDEDVEFIGHEKTDSIIKILKYRKVTTNDKILYHLVFNLTPFYPEGGGQIGDKGVISSDEDRVEILDTKRENNLIFHITSQLPNNIESSFLAEVNLIHRDSCSRSHSATHLLHGFLRKQLGEHVEQKGSHVLNDQLRFDFTHFAPLDKMSIIQLEKSINNFINSDVNLKEHKNVSLEEAKNMNAMMLFGEKYPEEVRVIQFGDFLELCGGTHVKSTLSIGSIKIISEKSVSAGVRRIEAIVGDKFKKYKKDMEDKLNKLALLLKKKDIIKAVEDLISENKFLQAEIQTFKEKEIEDLKEILLREIIDVNGINLIIKEVSIDAKSMKSLSFIMKSSHNNIIVLLSNTYKDKVTLSLMISDDLVIRGFNASDLIKVISLEIDGSGGGQPSFATAGGSKVSGVAKAFSVLKEKLSA